ncbi:ketopantoate reductase family protein [Oricola nitratireducens]|jgi:2-dehydropantoate 2-reductase|uniref:ketopantoate reductase family protein n=1 Tax=Oricola nitratireducens TaxID=2775868 RepID=UPI0018692DF6|nr:2-dehydropantoate 2-reductase [Oricola nitratireducens]
MRFVIFGVGAIGGGLAASLALAGYDVVGIARGAQLDAIQRNGLRVRTPVSDDTVRFPCVGAPDEISFRPDDVIFLTMKTQDTKAALESLERCGVRRQAIVCAQNGIENERLALRLFENVYAAVVMMPADFVKPGEVVVNCGPKLGVFNIGRYPKGIDSTTREICMALDGAGFAGFPEADVMPGKYGKLLMNLSNVLDAAAGEAARKSPLADAARAEAETVLETAGIPYTKGFRHDDLMQITPVNGAPRTGSSSAQSLVRKAGSIETGYLNGEIVLLGRLHGVPVPVNGFLCDLGRRLVAEGVEPGSLSLAEVQDAHEKY